MAKSCATAAVEPGTLNGSALEDDNQDPRPAATGQGQSATDWLGRDGGQKKGGGAMAGTEN
jgi:hypothetical protein